MRDSELHTEEENFIEEEHSIEEILIHLREKRLKLLSDLIMVENAIKYQELRIKK